MSDRSMSRVFSPRMAQSRWVPAPVIPPPMIMTSNSLLFMGFSFLLPVYPASSPIIKQIYKKNDENNRIFVVNNRNSHANRHHHLPSRPRHFAGTDDRGLRHRADLLFPKGQIASWSFCCGRSCWDAVNERAGA